MFNLEPVASRIFIKRTVVNCIGSIVILSSTKEFEMSEGLVMAVGPDCAVVKTGDNILFGKYAGATIERDGEKYVVINEDDVIAKINGGMENG